jgi:pimeloyl-ACP methyl ester carboxylesterase
MNPIRNIVAKFAFIQFPASYSEEIKYLSFVDRTEINSFAYDDIKIPIRFFRYKDSKLTMLICHGNGEDIGYDNPSHIAEKFGVNICMFDYAGYGMHSLKTSSEEDCYKDVHAVYHHLVNVENIKPEDIIIYGRSLGSGPASYLAHKLCVINKTPPRGLILISPLSSALKIILPCSILFSDMFKNYALAPHITCPSLVIHGNADTVVPYKCGQEVANLLPNLHEFVTLSNIGHNDIFVNSYYDSISTFIDFLDDVSNSLC